MGTCGQQPARSAIRCTAQRESRVRTAHRPRRPERPLTRAKRCCTPLAERSGTNHTDGAMASYTTSVGTTPLPRNPFKVGVRLPPDPIAVKAYRDGLDHL